MKKLALLTTLGILGATVFVFADFVEIKTGNGREYYSVYKRPKLNVCYVKRIKYYSDDGSVYLRYDGCGLYRDSCEYNGLAHFGHYPNPGSARRALNRCLTASPRFVD